MIFKKVYRLVFLAVSMTAMVSCNKFLDSGGENPGDNVNISIGDVIVDNGYYTIKTDLGNQLIATENNLPLNTLNEGDRVIANFVTLNNSSKSDAQKKYNIQLNAVEKILVKKPIIISGEVDYASGLLNTKSTEFFTNPVYIHNIWFSCSKYLNIEFEIKVDDVSIPHSIDFVVNNYDLAVSGGRPWALNFRHMSNGDGEKKLVLGRISFDVSELFAQRDYADISIKWLDYQTSQLNVSGELRKGYNWTLYTAQKQNLSNIANANIY